MDFGEPISVPFLPITIVEGLYACHPKLRTRYNLKVFLVVDSKIQMRRIRFRDGNDRAAEFLDKWLPLENKYFKQCRVFHSCDLICNSAFM